MICLDHLEAPVASLRFYEPHHTPRREPASVLALELAGHEWSPRGRDGVRGSGTRSLRVACGRNAPRWSPAALDNADACRVVADRLPPSRPRGLDRRRSELFDVRVAARGSRTMERC